MEGVINLRIIPSVLICLFLSLFGEYSPVFADLRPKPAIEISHIPPSINQLPLPGETIELTVRLTNTKDFDLPIRTMVSIDGVLLDLPLQSGNLDLREIPTYTVHLPAPQSSVSYQFFLYGPSGKVVSSKRYELARSCRPNINLVQVKDTSGNISDDPKELTKISNRLEREVKAYKEVQHLLESLEKKLSSRSNTSDQ